MRSRVVLPEPDGPSSATSSPLRDVEIDVLQRRLRAERLADPSEPQRRTGIGSSGVSGGGLR